MKATNGQHCRCLQKKRPSAPNRAPKGPILLGASPPDPPASAFGLHKVGLRPPWVPVRAGLGPNIIIYYIWAQSGPDGDPWRPKAD